MSPYVYPDMPSPQDMQNNILIAKICDSLKITLDQFRGSSRQRHLCDARKMACYLLKKRNPNMSLKRVGEIIKSPAADHSSIIHNLRQHDNYMVCDRHYVAKFNSIKI